MNWIGTDGEPAGWQPPNWNDKKLISVSFKSLEFKKIQFNSNEASCENIKEILSKIEVTSMITVDQKTFLLMTFTYFSLSCIKHSCDPLSRVSDELTLQCDDFLAQMVIRNLRPKLWLRGLYLFLLESSNEK